MLVLFVIHHSHPSPLWDREIALGFHHGYQSSQRTYMFVLNRDDMGRVFSSVCPIPPLIGRVGDFFFKNPWWVWVCLALIIYNIK